MFKFKKSAVVEYAKCGVCKQEVVKSWVFPDSKNGTCCIYCSGFYA